MKIRQSAADRIFMFFTYGLLLLFSLIVAYPIYFMCIASVSDPNAVMRGEVIFWFKDFTSLGYERIFSNDTIFRSYGNSILYTVLGVSISLLLTILPLRFHGGNCLVAASSPSSSCSPCISMAERFQPIWW